MTGRNTNMNIGVPFMGFLTWAWPLYTSLYGDTTSNNGLNVSRSIHGYVNAHVRRSGYLEPWIIGAQLYLYHYSVILCQVFSSNKCKI